jgi:hypothetical protein
VQFEEEQLARLERPKLRGAAGLPEIDFVVWSGRAQLVKPGFVRNSDEEADHDQSRWSIVAMGKEAPRLRLAGRTSIFSITPPPICADEP